MTDQTKLFVATVVFATVISFCLCALLAAAITIGTAQTEVATETVTGVVVRSVPVTETVYETKVVTETVYVPKVVTETKWREDTSKKKELETQVAELEAEIADMQMFYGQEIANYQCLVVTLQVRIEELEAHGGDERCVNGPIPRLWPGEVSPPCSRPKCQRRLLLTLHRHLSVSRSWRRDSAWWRQSSHYSGSTCLPHDS